MFSVLYKVVNFAISAWGMFSFIFQNKNLLKFITEGPEGVKWELGLACFGAEKIGFYHWDWDS